MTDIQKPVAPKVATQPTTPKHVPQKEPANFVHNEPGHDVHVSTIAPTQAELDLKDARKWGYDIGPEPVLASISVRNISENDLFLESGRILKGETGLATEAEVSNFLGKFLERA
jgi:hypothetical protein